MTGAETRVNSQKENSDILRSKRPKPEKMKLETYIFNLELKNTFRISHGIRKIQPTLIVKLTEGDYSGYGEAVATSYYGINVERMQKSVESVQKVLAKNIHRSPEEVWSILQPELAHDPFALCAIDMAMHDLDGKRKRMPLYKLWGYEVKNVPLTNYTIGMDSPDKMIEKMKSFPWPLYKIKLGTKEDVKIIKELRRYSDSDFRVDANEAWAAEETIENSRILKDLKIEFIEQPLPRDDWKGMKKVNKEAVLPVIADESCIAEADVEKCAGYFDGVNIKLTKCGGITPARRMIEKAKKIGLKTMVGCMTESTIGISAIAHLLPELDYVDMDGAMLLKNDIADGVKIDKKGVHFPNRNGTGAVLLPKYENLKTVQ